MIVLVGGRGFLAAHTRIALGTSRRVLVSRLPPMQPTLAPHETWMSRDAFDGVEGDAILSEARAIVYLASESVPGDSRANMGDELALNVTPATNLLDRLAAIGATARFIYISSGGTVYGTELHEDPVTEEHPLAPISPYGFGKVLIEEAIRFAGRSRGQPYAILRVANPVGPFTISEKQGIVPAAFRAVRSGTPLRVFGDGRAERDYLSAEDVGKAVVAAINATEFERAVWNVGSGCGRSILEILTLVRDAIGCDVPMEFVPARSGDVRRIVLDCSRIASDLGWRADNDLIRVIKNMWFENV
ncbi:NAD-dependent epimerase/dehydratase family protein [Agrobacterium vitis]|uniref:NAD-dependent epimerase/dehydratase family protein n=1 Tax=Agrobacterium vitis TaxID=373 RepID=UPI0009C114DE|nr:NAD-dependent epimerase/dehydratase family protein [Agrobacterium vitis]MCE6077181.1 NAD-dependent epimerase/dehydratase family protein [Agrobacterium vitis]MCF1453118.1 NAD-dependent epimerase/dehydratase family protein [Agrobacterium vitis]MCF1467874.1 NAD-dependent epimerase/dehydratase family protein [Agrobacterium vitis]MCM2452083.1 NAD-dependent epimerase/dehydratase family protein [Agrobacterium vitis]MCM2469096.1 NAD-dependent epimerase/dehydratase family protein [Agrobacterium viti